MTDPVQTELERRLAEVPRPAPVLSREAKQALTRRQREILGQLGELFRDGYMHLTMADLASAVGSSLRTIYSLAPSRDELVLVVVDRNLWKTGREAMAAIDPTMTPLVALQAYLAAANLAVVNTTEAFAKDTAITMKGSGISRSHNDYLVAVTTCLLSMAREQDEIGDIDIAATAHVVAGLGQTFAEPEMIPRIRSTPTAAANEVLGLLLAGLTAPRG